MAAYTWEFQARTNVGATVKSLAELDTLLRRLSQTTQIFTTGFSRIGSAFDGAASRAKRTSDAFNQVGNSKAGDNMKATAGAAGLLQNAMTAAATSSGGLGGALTAGLSIIPGYGQAIGAAAAALGKLSGAAQAAYDTLMRVGAPVDTLERGLEALLTPEELAAGGMERLIAEAEKLSLLPGIEQSSVLQGFQALRKSGNDVNDMLGKIAPSLALAQSEGIGVDTAAKNISVAWNIFNRELTASNTTFAQTAEIMAAAAMGAPIQDTAELTRGIKVAGQTFRTYHGDLKDTAAVMMMLAKSEYRGAEAGRAVRSIFRSLSKETPAVTGALRELGVSIQTSEGKLKTVPVILQELQDAFKNVANEGDAKRLQDALGGQFGSVLKTLVEEGKAGFDAMRKSIDDSAGALGRLQEAKINSLSGSVALFDSNWRNVQITLSKVIETPIIEFWKTTGNAVGTFGARLNALRADFEKIVKDFQTEGESPFEAWISALQQFDWSEIWYEVADTIKPVTDLVLKLIYNAVSAFQKWLVASIPKVIVQLGKFAVQVVISTAKEAGLWFLRIFTGYIDAVKSNIKGVWDFLRGKKPAPEQAAAPEQQPKAQTVILDEADFDAAIDGQAEVVALTKEERTIRMDMEDLQKKRLDGLRSEQQQRAAILQQMNAGLSAEAAMGLAGTSKGMAQAEAFSQEESRKEAAAKTDRAKAMLISGQRGGSFDDAMMEATGDRLKGEGLDATSAMLKQAQAVYGADRSITENAQKQKETSAALFNAPIDNDMKKDALETDWRKWLIAPLDSFKSKISEVFQTFGNALEGLGKKRIDVRTKGGIISEEGAKSEASTLLDRAIQNSEKVLSLAQSPGQKADALETLAGKQAEKAELTGDHAGFKTADSLLKKAVAEKELQQQDELKGIELDRTLAEKNIASLGKKQDGSASEAVQRLQTLFESYKSLGDISGASKVKESLQTAQQAASGESIGLLKQQVAELQLIRKALNIEGEKTRMESKDVGMKSLDTLRRIQAENGGFDPALAAPAF